MGDACPKNPAGEPALAGAADPDAAVATMLEKLDLVEHADKMTSEMSGGNRRKLSAAIALVAAPRVSFLDEPSSGMDVATRVHMWDMVRQSLSTGAVVLTTHSMGKMLILVDVPTLAPSR